MTKTYKESFLLKLLAWLFVYGGGNSESTQNPNVVAAILTAQEHIGLKGGEIPKVDLVIKLNKYIKELQSLKTTPERKEWLKDIVDEYGKRMLLGV